MKQLFKTNSGLRTEVVPVPTPGDNEVLVRVYFSLISTGTETGGIKKKADQDLSGLLNEKREQFNKLIAKFHKEGIKPAFEKIKDKITPGERNLIYKPIGYSNAGVIIEKGRSVKGFNIGDRVACAGSGIAAHAEYVSVPVNLVVKIPDNLTFDKASFTTVASIALQGIRRANAQPGETIVIYGLGLLGLIAVQIAKAYGYKVIGVDIVESKVKLALELGADSSFMFSSGLSEKIHQLTAMNGADAVIVYASSPQSDIVNQAMYMARRKGRIVIVGNVGMDIKRDEMYKKELDLVMSTSYGPGRYDDNYELKGIDYPLGYVRWTENRNMLEVIRLLSEEKIKVEPLINEIFSIEDSEKAFESLTDKEKNYISVLFKYVDEDKHEAGKILNLNLPARIEGKISVGLIGAGGFAKRTHLPNLQKLDTLYVIKAIADRDPVNAKMTGKFFKAEYVTTDYKEILNDPSIDMIIIATRHNLHAGIVQESLKANKHILVEKPLALTSEELSDIKRALVASKSIIRVGFNRRYSPLVQKMVYILRKESQPLFINYRINAGYLPKEHWTQDENTGGGRIIGEFCHFIDLVNYLVSSEIVSLDVVSIPVDNKYIYSEDNIAVNISYKNGSIAQISYNSIGAKDLPKERIEVFFAKKTMIINDFIELEMFNTGESNIKLSVSDKGHLEELRIFANILKNQDTETPSFDFDIQSTEYTLQIMNILNKGSLS